MRPVSLVICLVVVAVVSAACDDDDGVTADTTVVSDGAPTDGSRPDKLLPDAPIERLKPCTPAFGTPVAVTLAQVGRTIVVEGLSRRASNIVKPVSDECVQLGQSSLRAALLQPNQVTPANEQIQMLDKDGTEIFCGCSLMEQETCKDLPSGKQLRVKGALTRRDTGKDCTQIPCYRLKFEASCLVN
jgi:hypothetical protein